MTQTMITRRHLRIAEFAKFHGTLRLSVRGRANADRLNVTEIRSTRHDIDAMIYDDLGNAFIMNSGGACRQLITDTEIKRALEGKTS